MANPTDFLLNTDYEMDKIIYFVEGTVNAGQWDVQFAHNLGFTPLIFGTCSFNSDFSDPHPIPFEQQTSSNTIQFNADANGTNIRVSYINYNGSPAKIYYRIYGFEPDGSTKAIAPTASKAKKFILNTDYNYCKLYRKGTAPGNTNTSITHDFGYPPQVLAWQEAAGWISPITRSDFGDIDGSVEFHGVVVNDTQVRFDLSLYQYDKIHYRIYYDEA